MGVREMDRFLEQCRYQGFTPADDSGAHAREREHWQGTLLLPQERDHAAGCGCESCLVIRAVRDAALPNVMAGNTSLSGERNFRNPHVGRTLALIRDFGKRPGKFRPNQPCAHPSTRAIVGASLSKG